MDTLNPLLRAIQLLGLVSLARGVGVTHQAVRKWGRAGRMPRTEWTGETNYSAQIEALTEGAVTRAQLLGSWSVPGGDEHDRTVPQPVPSVQTLKHGVTAGIGGQPHPESASGNAGLMFGDRRGLADRPDTYINQGAADLIVPEPADRRAAA